MKFGEKLKKLRDERNYSQMDLAARSAVSLRAIQNYETKGILPKKRETYDLLAKALNVEVGLLIDDKAEFRLEALEKYGSRGERQARSILDQVEALYAGGELSEQDMEAFNRALQEAYWDAKAVNRKFASKRFRKNPKDASD